jgi:hypothetical protein
LAKKPATRSDPTGKPRRGRPRKPGGRIPQVEVQRAYRARLAAAGKVVRTVDAGAVSPTPAGVAQLSIPDFDPAKDGVFERQMVASTRDQFHNALSELELREEEVTRLRDRNAYLESELKLQERYLTNALKDNIVLKQKTGAETGQAAIAPSVSATTSLKLPPRRRRQGSARQRGWRHRP